MDASERAIKTAIQVFVAGLGLGSAGVDVFNINWRTTTGLALSAGLGSLLTSILSAKATNNSQSGSLITPPSIQAGAGSIIQPTGLR